MKLNRNFLKLLTVSLLLPLTVLAQDKTNDMTPPKPEPSPVKKFYVGSSLDGAIFSVSTLTSPFSSQKTSTFRFSYFINLGVTFNYDFTKHVGLYTGVDLKNIGFIEKKNDSTIKRRTYNLGIPLGIKFGNVENHMYGFVGGGVDFPLNYREKGFVKRGHKEKLSEWFSDRTPATMPYIFAGVCIKPGVTIKLQYYLNNYMNPDYTLKSSTTKPYAGYDVHPILLSFGIQLHYSKKTMHHMMKSNEAAKSDEEKE